ncbi:hypothetical protein ZWY2020_016470 [Hordeum vulgare]|nr:hypothetical protein ZWY2020_016470 [Hordeum vulgare]
MGQARRGEVRWSRATTAAAGVASEAGGRWQVVEHDSSIGGSRWWLGWRSLSAPTRGKGGSLGGGSTGVVDGAAPRPKRSSSLVARWMRRDEVERGGNTCGSRW